MCDSGQGVGLSLSAPQPSACSFPDEFLGQVRDALENLYDPVCLQRHPLIGLLLPVVPASGTQRARILRQRVLDGIEQLKPCGLASDAERAWRVYRILCLRYVEGLTFREVMTRLSLSQTQYHREQRRAIKALAGVLWEARANCDIDLLGVRPLLIFQASFKLLQQQGAGKAVPRPLAEQQEYVWLAVALDDRLFEDGRREWGLASASSGAQAPTAGSSTASIPAPLAMLVQAVAGSSTASVLLAPPDRNALELLFRRARERGIAILAGNWDAPDKSLHGASITRSYQDLGTPTTSLAS